MDRSEMIDRLMRAQEALASVLAEVKPDASECDSCGHMRYGDFNLKQAADAIQGSITRVEKACRYIQDSATTRKRE